MRNDDFKLPFGKHKGKTFREVPLEYLDWLVGWLEETMCRGSNEKRMMDEFPRLYRCAVEYLKDNHYGEDNGPE